MPEIKAAVVGIRYRGPEALHAVCRMEPGSRVRLVREPGNPHDSYAVQVWFLGLHVGFIPGQANGQLARAMDEGAEPTAEVEIAPVVRGDRIEQEPLLLIGWSPPASFIGGDRHERQAETRC